CINPAVVSEIVNLVNPVLSDLRQNSKLEPVVSARAISLLTHLPSTAIANVHERVPTDAVSVRTAGIAVILNSNDRHARFIDEQLVLKLDLANTQTGVVLYFP